MYSCHKQIQCLLNDYTPRRLRQHRQGAMSFMQGLLEQQQAFLQQQQEAQRTMMENLLQRQREETETYRRELEDLRRRREEVVAKPKLPKPTLQKLAPDEDIENLHLRGLLLSRSGSGPHSSLDYCLHLNAMQASPRIGTAIIP